MYRNPKLRNNEEEYKSLDTKVQSLADDLNCGI